MVFAILCGLLPQHKPTKSFTPYTCISCNARFMFIPKTEQGDDIPHSASRIASLMCLLSLSKSDAVLVAAAVASPLNDFVDINAHPH
jgi:hypothetical protein